MSYYAEFWDSPLYNPSRKANRHYNRFVNFLSKRIFDDHPAWNEVRIQLVRSKTTLPGEPENDREKARFIRVRKRDGA